MKAEIIAIGTEILLGEIVDTNTSYIAGQLATLGIDLYHASTVGDNHERLLGALRQAWGRSDIIFTTGGLGPTEGDITRECIARLLNEKPEEDEGLRRQLAGWFASHRLEMPRSNIKQATLIPSAVGITNSCGTAPGWWAEKEGKLIVALPGPPGELQPMWQNEVLPKLAGKGEAVILSRTLKLWGIGEAKVNEMAMPFLSGSNPTLAMYARADGIHLRIAAKAPVKESARALTAKLEKELRQIYGNNIWGADEDTLEGVVGRFLSDRKLSLAVAERYTGGFLTGLLASAPDNSYFKGGMVVNSEDAGNIFGAESHEEGNSGQETAAVLASLARSRFNADIGIGLYGYTGMVDDVKMGKIFIAIDAPPLGQKVTQNFSWRLPQIARRAAYHALFSLRNMLTP